MAAVLADLRYSSCAHDLGSTAAGIVGVAHPHTATPLGDAQVDVFKAMYLSLHVARTLSSRT